MKVSKKYVWEGLEGWKKRRNVSYYNIKKISQIGEIGLGDLLHRECFLCQWKKKTETNTASRAPEFRQHSGSRIGEINHSEGTVLNTHRCQNSFHSRHIGLTLPYNQLVLCSICF